MNVSIITPLSRLKKWGRRQIHTLLRPNGHKARPNLSDLATDISMLPGFVQQSATAMRYLHLLGVLDWGSFPERDLETPWARPPVSYTSFAAACLIQLGEGIPYMPRLRRYLVEHPALIWMLGFPLKESAAHHWGFDPDGSLPTARHFTRMLRRMPNEPLQFLLDETGRLLQAELSTEVDDFGQCISLDTKHIVAWVKENNPKAYVSDRYNKEKQPAGDPDCRLGCKRRHNHYALSDSGMPTPLENPVPASQSRVGEYYWGVRHDG